MASVPELDMEKVQAFAFKTLGDIISTQMDMLNLDRRPPRPLPDARRVRPRHQRRVRREAPRSTSGTAASGSPRWPATGTLTYDDATKRFTLPPEHAAVLADVDSGLYLGSFPAMHKAFFGNADELTEAFKHGGGVPQDRYGDDFWCGFERFSRTAFRNNLVQDWIPAMPQVDAALRAGGSVADIGCGNGQALIYPRQGLPRGDTRRLRQLRPRHRGGKCERRTLRGWRTGCATRSAT